MQPFAELLDRLVLTPSRNGKLRLMADHFRDVPDPERGYALAAITGGLDIRSVKPAMLRALMADRMDEVLFGYSYDYVGDLAETIALVWPAPHDGDRETDPPTLEEVISELDAATRAEGPKLVEAWLDRLDSSGRYALLKLVTGSMRIGVSSRLAKQALADFGQKDVSEIEELWHGLDVPYLELFAWLEGRAEKPVSAAASPFRPVMLSQPLEAPDYGRILPADYAAEWKWDGIRVQATVERGVRRLYSRTGDDISHAFPDLLAAMDYEGSLDGELLVARPAAKGRAKVKPHEGPPEDDIVVGTFSDLQQRLNRKAVSAAVMDKHPVFLRAYDLLQDGPEDLRALPFAERRQRLDPFVAALESTRFDISPFVPFESFEDLGRLRVNPPHPVIEGVMLKRWDSAYVPGRPKGPWFKWKQDPHLIDAVLMYAQRGHGKRSSFYSDYTFGVWAGEADQPELVPVGKAYFGFTDEELKLLDKYIRDNTIQRFGPVRSVRAEPDHGLVLEVAFEGLQRSTRHKSGVAMRFPRISRLRWDKPAFEADRIETLQAMLGEG
ncbi:MULTISPECIES: cisplatin damage response ATP-dependent DNA ligase [unclassified Aureimonas]|uniref:cisplatin damage response ATP-dependent DNA ligase n=1 Tax=unclassified Aureimonas TaxID=2615206 RepID=UPI0006FF57CF|nr:MULTISPECIES: cisplatin damage response ATP-dependent DNA ligase [unclassified Aureimonas]KQT60676.1 ATP-dependent DNA ligase [Aureimonas sp. Leaf460]KQT68805.1 ATP-dependent DNA ligase [Aureimonas sp. Leaf427]